MTRRATTLDAEYRRYKLLAEAASAQLPDADLSRPGPNDGNSIAVIVAHLAGNLTSRFTDFLTTDGEKPWRLRDREFDERPVGRLELLQRWNAGWTVLFDALATLGDEDFARTVTIRTQPMTVDAALTRSLAHASYHVGQIVYLAKSFRGPAWISLSIPRGQSEAYTQRSAIDTGPSHRTTRTRPQTD